MDHVLGYKSDANRRLMHRALYHEAYLHPQWIDLPSQQIDVLSVDRKKDDKITQQAAAADPDSLPPFDVGRLDLEQVVVGQTEVMPNDLHGQRIRRNLTISVKGVVILQRFVPPFEKTHQRMLQEIQIGREHFDKMSKTSRPSQTASQRAGSTSATRNCTDFDSNIEDGQGGDLRSGPAIDDSKESSSSGGVYSNASTSIAIADAKSNADAGKVDGEHDAAAAAESVTTIDRKPCPTESQGRVLRNGKRLLESPPTSLLANNTAPAVWMDRYHLGVWYGQGSRYATPTSDTRRIKSDEEQEATTCMLRFMAWLRRYVDAFVHPLVQGRIKHDSKMLAQAFPHRKPRHSDDSRPERNLQHLQCAAVATNFDESLARRAKAYEWLVDEVPIAQDLCHPLYSG